MRYFTILFMILIIGCSGKSYSSRGFISQKDDVDLCVPACDRAKELNCAEGNDLIYPTSCSFDAECESGKCIVGKCTETCIDVCEVFVRKGRSQNLSCWKTINTCEQIETVCRR